MRPREMGGQLLGVAKLGPGIPRGIRRDELGTIASECQHTVSGLTVPARKAYRVTVGRQAPVTVTGDGIGRIELRLGS
ncbi:hypothetical protein SMC26_33045 [Actinomadura fulvescens]|uniref:Uncharacterized protein n=1 Tax=Actinomadura fulvescens TaxID=46160 RepID=A0ABP6CNW3_9ACTN